MTKGKTILIATLIALPIAVIIVAAVIMFTPIGMHVAPFYGDTFDPGRWRTAHQGKTPTEVAKKQSQCIRGAMYGDLKHRVLKPGINRAKVVALIGVPDFGSGGVHKGHQCARWNLGMCSGFKIDFDSLNVCFDKEGIVRHVFRLQH